MEATMYAVNRGDEEDEEGKVNKRDSNAERS